MLNKGQYVRHKMAREALIGTIEGAEILRGRVFYRFQQDPRLREPASALLRETSFSEDELEVCEGHQTNIGRALTGVSKFPREGWPLSAPVLGAACSACRLLWSGDVSQYLYLPRREV